jgi:hypothetical protein
MHGENAGSAYGSAMRSFYQGRKKKTNTVPVYGMFK